MLHVKAKRAPILGVEVGVSWWSSPPYAALWCEQSDDGDGQEESQPVGGEVGDWEADGESLHPEV